MFALKEVLERPIAVIGTRTPFVCRMRKTSSARASERCQLLGKRRGALTKLSGVE